MHAAAGPAGAVWLEAPAIAAAFLFDLRLRGLGDGGGGLREAPRLLLRQ